MKKLFSEGNKVRFLHTGDIGTILHIIDDKMVNVRLLDGDEIPAYLEDIVVIDADKSTPKVYKGKVVSDSFQPKKSKERKIIKGHRWKNTGLLLAFEAYQLDDGSVESYDAYLVNDTKYDIIYKVTLTIQGDEIEELNEKLPAKSAVELGELMFDELNDHPVYAIEVWRVTTMGLDDHQTKFIKIKPKQFFKKLKEAPILEDMMHVYEVFGVLRKEAANSKEDLKNYAKRNVNTRKTKKLYQDYSKVTNIKERAEQTDVIDLHIENLTDKSKSMTKSDMLHLQIRVFEKFLDKAIRVGLPRIFIIHGVGKGRLKNEIHSILIKNPYVKTFKNEHHPKYGFGATEAIID